MDYRMGAEGDVSGPVILRNHTSIETGPVLPVPPPATNPRIA